MKITIVQGAFFPVPPIMGGAVEKIWFGLGQEFVRQGHSVTHFSRRHPSLPNSEIIGGVQHFRVSGFQQPRSLPLLKLKDLLYSLAVRRRLPAADIIVTNTFFLPLLLRGEKHGRLCVNVNRFPRGQMRWYLHAARLQAVSTVIHEAILEQTPAAASISKILPNPLPADFIVPATPPPKNRERDEFLFVGRIHPEKGLDLLLPAFAQHARTSTRPCRLRIAGPDTASLGGAGPEYLAKLKQLAGPASPSIEWLGPIFDPAALRTLYAESHFLIYPSIAGQGEASPVTPVESMAFACIPIVSDLRCFNDYLEPGVNGFSFALGEHAVNNLAATFATASALGPKLPALQQNCLATAHNYTASAVARRYEADFQALLDARR